MPGSVENRRLRAFLTMTQTVTQTVTRKSTVWVIQTVTQAVTWGLRRTEVKRSDRKPLVFNNKGYILCVRVCAYVLHN